MGNGRRVSAAVAALTTVIVLGAAASAQAQITIGLNLNLGISISAPYIEGLLNGENQPLDGAGNLLCQTGQTVGGNLPGGEPVNQALCAIPALDYQFITRFKRASSAATAARSCAVTPRS
jgi:hypothetical protein